MHDRGKLTFNPTLSFDGVAIITACIGCAVWFGSLSETVKEHTETLRQHEVTMKTLADTENVMAQNIAVLQAMVSDIRNNLPKTNQNIKQ